jgi:hypothetical protein
MVMDLPAERFGEGQLSTQCVERRIGQDILKGDRAEYGQQIVHSLSGQLTAEYGPGFTLANLFHMVRFAEAFPEEKIVYTV